MPEAEVANAGQGQNAQARGGSNVLGTIIRMLIFWYMFSWFKGGNKGPTTPENTAVAKYSKGHLLDMYVFMSEKPNFRGFNVDELIWEEKGVGLAEKMDRTYAYTYHPSKYVQNNGSLYLHSLFVDSGRDIEDEAVQADVTIHTHALIKYMPRPKEKVGTNLLTGEHAPGGPMPEVKEDKPREIVSFFKPNATIVMIDHFQSYPKNAIPPQYAGFMVFDEDGDYYPIIIYNDFWLLRDKMILMNETVTEVTLNLRLTSLHHWWWQMQMQMEQSFMMQSSMGMTQEGESDEFKRVLLEGNPYLLAVTFVVSCLHSVFDFLAFKNDIGFWKENKSMEGLSARSVIINAFCQAVIFLYLMDSETSFVVLLSSGAGTAIEFWKVTKAMHVSFDPKKFPYIHFKDRKSYGQKDTKKFDEEAMRYLSYALYPLVIGYAVYTLIYETHKSWYSWLLSTLVGAVYTFGFILMCPQLYLNYKLKSVAHLPWRQMTYKFLNTIIDDLFAFVIKMPLLHRLSVFRDDVVFFIYIYQRWIYRVDKTRANEFGYMEEKPEEEEAEQQEEEKSEKDKEDLGDSSTGKKAARKDASKKEVPIADVASQDEGSSKKDL